jgi:hypothetical protein
MIATTIKSSISVNPFTFLRNPFNIAASSFLATSGHETYFAYQRGATYMPILIAMNEYLMPSQEECVIPTYI